MTFEDGVCGRVVTFEDGVKVRDEDVLEAGVEVEDQVEVEGATEDVAEEEVTVQDVLEAEGMIWQAPKIGTANPKGSES